MAERREVGFKFFEAVDLPNKRTFGVGDMNICAQVQLWKGDNRVCVLQTLERKGGSYCDLEGQVVAFHCLNSSFGSDFTAKVFIFHKSGWTDDIVDIGNFLIEVPEVSKPPAFYQLFASGAQTSGRVKMSVVVEELGSELVPIAMQNPRATSGFVTNVAVAVMTGLITDSIKHIFS